MAFLELKSLTKDFGGLTAVNNLDLELLRGEITGLIGPNGAGKTTVFNLVTGFLQPTRGKVVYKGKDVTSLKPNELVERGITRTFQLTTLFGDMTVADNLYIAFHLQAKSSFWGSVISSPNTRRKENEIQEKIKSIMEFMGISELGGEMARNLPHGHQRMLGIGMAIATNPEMLLLDEPVSGMNQEEINNAIKLIRRIRDGGVTILLVEHSMRTVMELCDRIAVLNFGGKIAEGSPKEISLNEEVIRAYLGSEQAA